MFPALKSVAFPWLPARTILLVRHGSHAYGTQVATSDEDFKGIAIPPAAYFFGFTQKFEQAEVKVPDMVVYDIRKFFNLAADCNPNILEVLWVDPSDYIVCTPLAEKLLASRQLFLSRKARFTFFGYAQSQLKRIKGHYRWLKDPPKAPPTRAESGLPERPVIPGEQLLAAQAAVQKKLDTWEWKHLEDIDPAARIAVQSSFEELVAELMLFRDENARHRMAARTLRYDENFIELLDRERQHQARQRDWEQYQLWLKQRNPARSELEAKFGYDTKHAMHLVRLMRMCREILELGEVRVKRPDREELLAIRQGLWSYEALLEWTEGQEPILEGLYQRSSLPKSPDKGALDRLCQTLVEEALRTLP